QRADDLAELRHRARPAVRDDERERPGTGAAGMDEVDAEAADLGAELREAVQRGLGRPPVIALRPMGNEGTKEREIRPVSPAGVRDFVRKPGARQTLAEVLERGIGHRDAKGLEAHVRPCTLPPWAAARRNTIRFLLVTPPRSEYRKAVRQR